MTASAYPSGLPVPQALPLRPTERRLTSGLPGPRQFRGLQRDFHASVSAQWIFTAEQARQFNAWWRDEILRGGLWFSASWPLPSGDASPVFRFYTPPSWSHVPGGLWRVAAELEVRGRGMPPQLPWIYLTSRPYPAVVTDSLGVAGDWEDLQLISWPEDDATLAADFVGGTLQIIRFDAALEEESELHLAGDFLGGTLTGESETVLVYDEGLDEADVAGDFIGGTLELVRLVYDNAMDEVAVGGDFVGGTLE